MQRHARKLNARVFAPRYRLAPQFPFPCGLLDCLAAYLFLISVQDPSTIILAGDSAGGGMVLSMLVTLRDRGLPLPAGAILISPWVDLTHSFPSVAGNNELDYIPPHGFLQRPSEAWPPPNSDDMEHIAMHAVEQLVKTEMPRHSTHMERKQAHDDAVQGFSVDHEPSNLHPKANPNNPAGNPGVHVVPGNTIPNDNVNLSIMIDGNMVEIKDQIQMYATNQLISHPLVSPVLQPSLGGLPPLLIQTGGGEMLRDEQIYLAHKAANPSKYPPGDAYLDEYPEARDIIKKWKPTDVQLQVWDDLCHVAPTLSFTRPAKYMYRSIAQFGAWCLARAGKTEIEILDDDDVSIISTGSDTESDEGKTERREKSRAHAAGTNGANANAIKAQQVGKAGDPLPPFHNHMIRQRIDRHGSIHPLEDEHSLPALQMSPNEIGVIKPGPVRKWMAAKAKWDRKFAAEKRRLQKTRVKEMIMGYQGFGNDEVPPPSALAGRRGLSLPKQQRVKRSWGLSMWGMWGSSHDKDTIAREEKADKDVETVVATEEDGQGARKVDETAALTAAEKKHSDATTARSRSRSRIVRDEGQTATPSTTTTTADLPTLIIAAHSAIEHGMLSPNFVPIDSTDGTSTPADGRPLHLPGTNVTLDSAVAKRPKADGIAFPFKLGAAQGEDAAERNASMVTLTSRMAGVETPSGEEGEREGKMLGAEKGEDLGAEERGRPVPERFETAKEI
jgi:acetyl esterase/lipase